jgi:Protein of unknown function (DUF3224)
MRGVASFDLDSFDWEPPYRDEGGVQHARAHVNKTFRGDIEGRGSVEMLAAQSQGGAGYVALEHITGRLNGWSGGFSLLHVATRDADGQWARWPIVPGSGTGDLTSIRGEGRIDIDAEGKHTFTLDYEFD